MNIGLPVNIGLGMNIGCDRCFYMALRTRFIKESFNEKRMKES